MLVKRNGIFKTIDSKDFGIYQAAGFEKVSKAPVPNKKTEPIVEKPEEIKEVKPEVIEEVKPEVIEEVAKVEEEHNKKNKNNK